MNVTPSTWSLKNLHTTHPKIPLQPPSKFQLLTCPWTPRACDHHTWVWLTFFSNFLLSLYHTHYQLLIPPPYPYFHLSIPTSLSTSSTVHSPRNPTPMHPMATIWTFSNSHAVHGSPMAIPQLPCIPQLTHGHHMAIPQLPCNPRLTHGHHMAIPQLPCSPWLTHGHHMAIPQRTMQ